MKIRAFLVFAAAGIFGLWCAPIQTSAQVERFSGGQVVLSKLSPPIFPPLARAARVTGDVEIAVQIRQDGTVESAEVVKGHPLLKAAALDSARQSTFECHDCGDVPRLYSVLYTFGYTTTQHCCQPQAKSVAGEPGAEPQAGITQSQNHITILSEPLCICDPSADVIKVRSAKCLFLWHCSKRWGL
jgi:TonB family protein